MQPQEVNIVETSPIKAIKHCIVGLPDVGLVGSIAASYLVQETEMEEVGYIESDIFPPIVVIHNGTPQSPFRIYRKGDITIFISEVPVEPYAMPLLAKRLIEWAKSKNIELLISLSGIAVPNRLEIDVPKVYGVGTSPAMNENFRKIYVEPFEEGFMVGFHALVIKECLKIGLNNMILLAQSHLQYPDPGAAASIVNSLNALLKLEVNVKKLLEKEEEIRLRMRELMYRTQRTISQMPKSSEQEIPMMYV
jgi:uncharacterized protein